ncbi:SGNH/GDSL hydrolase family protein [Methylobacterium crusticola]|uniref:SGNH/GDSL hydrolase family protein n=1 Tax=Methylobacterium crusticola TaxID=1697972 RepID=UPI000FFB4F11|nr:SGNH/GDSL hydrolase family protein [Methylobacterium crusticola]
MRVRREVWIAAAAFAAAAGAGAWLARGGETGQEMTAFREARAFAVSAQIGQIAGPYSLLLGDSQLERLYLPRLCGAPAVDAGIAGTRAAGLRGVVARIRLPRPPAAIVVTVGTNDLTRRHRAAERDAAEGFRRDVRGLMADLAPLTRTLVATPVPPFDAARAGIASQYDAGEEAAYSAIVAEECARAGCRFLDIYAGRRSPEALALSPDGVHLGLDPAARDDIAGRLEGALCADRAVGTR